MVGLELGLGLGLGLIMALLKLCLFLDFIIILNFNNYYCKYLQLLPFKHACIATYGLNLDALYSLYCCDCGIY